MKDEPFVIERTLNAPPEKVWQAITDREKMKQWNFAIAEFKPEVGYEFTFTGGTPENCYLHLCKITKVDPGRILQYSWRYDGYTGNSFVTFELTPEGNATKLKLTHEGLDTFPADNADFARGNFVEGWTYLIGKSIKEFVEQ